MGGRSRNAIALFDKYVLFLLEELKDPTRRRVFLQTLLQDIALESESLADRKNFELLAALVTVISKDSTFISEETFKEIRSLISSKYRGVYEIRASNALYSIHDLVYGELSVRRFLTEKAWHGLPGFGEEWDLDDPSNLLEVHRQSNSVRKSDLQALEAGFTRIGNVRGSPWGRNSKLPFDEEESSEEDDL